LLVIGGLGRLFALSFCAAATIAAASARWWLRNRHRCRRLGRRRLDFDRNAGGGVFRDHRAVVVTVWPPMTPFEPLVESGATLGAKYCDADTLFLGRGIEQPQQEEERHHRRH